MAQAHPSLLLTSAAEYELPAKFNNWGSDGAAAEHARNGLKLPLLNLVAAGACKKEGKGANLGGSTTLTAALAAMLPYWLVELA